MHGMNEIYLLCMHKECITGTQYKKKMKRRHVHMKKKTVYLLYLDFSWVSWCTCIKVANGEIYFEGICNKNFVYNKRYRFLWIATFAYFNSLNIRVFWAYWCDFNLIYNSKEMIDLSIIAFRIFNYITKVGWIVQFYLVRQKKNSTCHPWWRYDNIFVSSVNSKSEVVVLFDTILKNCPTLSFVLHLKT